MKTKLKDVFNIICGCDWVVVDCTIYYDPHKDSMGHSLKSRGDIVKIDILSAPFLLRYGCSSSGTSWIEYLLKGAKPVLRPFHDITKREMEELIAINRTEDEIITKIELKNEMVTFIKKAKRGKYGLIDMIRLDEVKSNEFIYLLKQGFDVFGLIESKQAIDKTKL